VLEVSGHLHISDRHEAEARVAQPLLESFCEHHADAIRDSRLPFSSHFSYLPP
jgi:hypothetical protein